MIRTAARTIVRTRRTSRIVSVPVICDNTKQSPYDDWVNNKGIAKVAIENNFQYEVSQYRWEEKGECNVGCCSTISVCHMLNSNS